MNGAFRLEGNEWIADTWARLAKDIKAVDPKIYLINGVTALSTFTGFTKILLERGGASPCSGDSWCGGITGQDDADVIKNMMDFYNEHEMFFSVGIMNSIQEAGPISAIDEAFRNMCEYTKSYPRFSPSVNPAAAHWTSFEYVDAGIAAVKKYGKY